MNVKTFLSAVMLTLMVTLLSCSGNQSKKSGKIEGAEVGIDSACMIVPEYAKGFTVNYVSDDVCLVEIGDPQHILKEDDDDEDYQMPVDYKFALVRNGAKADVPEGYKVVNVPIERTICMTSLQLSNFTALDAHSVIRGITGTKNLFDEDIKRRVKAGDIVKIGMEGDFDTELVLAASPDVIFISPFKRGGYDAIRRRASRLFHISAIRSWSRSDRRSGLSLWRYSLERRRRRTRCLRASKAVMMRCGHSLTV